VRAWSRPKYPAPPAANPPLSAEMSSWLDGREERDRNWDAKDTEWLQRHISRSAWCNDPTLSKRMFVTGLTLNGKSALTGFHSNSRSTQASISTPPSPIQETRAVNLYRDVRESYWYGSASTRFTLPSKVLGEHAGTD
jgi:hypothetical protein